MVLNLSEVKSRAHDSKPRSRTQKKSEGKARTALPRADPLEAKGRNARGQGPRMQAQEFSKKKVFKNFFQAKKILKSSFSNYLQLRKTKKGLRKFCTRFLAVSNKISTVQKIVLSSSRGQGNFRELEASRPRTWLSRPRPRISRCVFEDVLVAKDVLEDSTSGIYSIKLPKEVFFESPVYKYLENKSYVLDRNLTFDKNW